MASSSSQFSFHNTFSWSRTSFVCPKKHITDILNVPIDTTGVIITRNLFIQFPAGVTRWLSPFGSLDSTDRLGVNPVWLAGKALLSARLLSLPDASRPGTSMSTVVLIWLFSASLAKQASRYRTAIMLAPTSLLSANHILDNGRLLLLSTCWNKSPA